MAAGADAYHLGTCLSALSFAALFELAFDRRVELETGMCEGCVLHARVSRILDASLRDARRLLADYGRDGNLVVIEGGAGASSYAEDGKTEGGRPAFQGGAPKRALRPRRASLQSKGEDLVFKQKPARVPEPRRSLEAFVSRKGPGAGEAFPWPVHTVDAASCRACGLCRQLCPSGAIRHAMRDGLFTYSFVPGLCLDCRLCVDSCQARAIERDYAPDPRPFVERPCCEQPAGTCLRCRKPALERYGLPYCPQCQAEMRAMEASRR